MQAIEEGFKETKANKVRQVDDHWYRSIMMKRKCSPTWLPLLASGKTSQVFLYLFSYSNRMRLFA